MFGSRPGQKLVPAELRVNTHNWKLDDVQHPAVNARKILLKKIDTEMRKAGLIRDHPKIIRRIALSDKVENYKSLDRAVSECRNGALFINNLILILFVGVVGVCIIFTIKLLSVFFIKKIN